MFRKRLNRFAGLAVALLAAVFLLFGYGYERTRQPRLNRALIAAIKRGDSGAVHDLLKSGADANARDDSTLRSASQQWGQDILSILRPRRSSLIPVWCKPAIALAAESGDASIVRDLLDRGARVDERWSMVEATALVSAVDRGHTEVARILLEHGADPNAVGGYAGQCGPPLAEAAARNNLGMVRMLLDHGADPNGGSQDPGDILYRAERNHQTALVVMLKKAGAIDANDGENPSEHATAKGR